MIAWFLVHPTKEIARLFKSFCIRQDNYGSNYKALAFGKKIIPLTAGAKSDRESWNFQVTVSYTLEK